MSSWSFSMLEFFTEEERNVWGVGSWRLCTASTVLPWVLIRTKQQLLHKLELTTMNRTLHFMADFTSLNLLEPHLINYYLINKTAWMIQFYKSHSKRSNSSFLRSSLSVHLDSNFHVLTSKIKHFWKQNIKILTIKPVKINNFLSNFLAVMLDHETQVWDWWPKKERGY